MKQGGTYASMEGVPGKEREASFADRVQLLLKGLVFFGVLVFVVLGGIRLEADSRGAAVGGFVLSWLEIMLPLFMSLALAFLWLVVDYFKNSPLRGLGTPSSQRSSTSGGPEGSSAALASRAGQEQGNQFYYNVMSQLLVKNLDSYSIESYNEASMLRDILRGLVYLMLIGLCAFGCTLQCSGCAVPYDMLGYGFLACYVVRFFMLVYNGFHSYYLYRDLAEEVQSYQESLDHIRLFHVAVPHLDNKSKRRLEAFVDAFMWMATIAFLVLGTLWVSDGECRSSCATTFHLHHVLVVTIILLEGVSLLLKLCFIYFLRISHIEGFFALASQIHKRQDRMELKQQ